MLSAQPSPCHHPHPPMDHLGILRDILLNIQQLMYEFGPTSMPQHLQHCPIAPKQESGHPGRLYPGKVDPAIQPSGGMHSCAGVTCVRCISMPEKPGIASPVHIPVHIPARMPSFICQLSAIHICYAQDCVIHYISGRTSKAKLLLSREYTRRVNTAHCDHRTDLPSRPAEGSSR